MTDAQKAGSMGVLLVVYLGEKSADWLVYPWDVWTGDSKVELSVHKWAAKTDEWLVKLLVDPWVALMDDQWDGHLAYHSVVGTVSPWAVWKDDWWADMTVVLLVLCLVAK